MNPAHLILASDHCIAMRAAILEAHRDAIKSGNPFVEMAVFDLLPKSAMLEDTLKRVVSAAKENADPEAAFAQKVIKELTGRGIADAYWEFPDYIRVPLTNRKDDSYLACGIEKE